MKSKLRTLVEQMQQTATSHLVSDGISAERFATAMVTALDCPQQREAFKEDDFDYQAEALATLSPHFYGEKVTLIQFIDCLNRFVEVGNELDAIKKALFYGKDNELLDALGDNINCNSLMLEAPANAANIIHAILGIATESTELIEALKKPYLEVAGPVSFDHVNLAEEGGDSLWYHALLFHAIGTDFEAVQRLNIAKLQKKRFKNATFAAEEAINRDTAAERMLLEAGTKFKNELESIGVAVGGVSVLDVGNEVNFTGHNMIEDTVEMKLDDATEVAVRVLDADGEEVFNATKPLGAFDALPITQTEHQCSCGAGSEPCPGAFGKLLCERTK